MPRQEGLNGARNGIYDDSATHTGFLGLYRLQVQKGISDT